MRVPQTSGSLRLKYDVTSNKNSSYHKLPPGQLMKSMRQVLLSPHFLLKMYL